jgi:modulator of FtsH protease
MTPEAFGAAELGWHDFFVATAGASAALLGLLFVGVSINLNAITGEERVDLRARAGQAFANLIFVLVIALLMLIPDPDPGSIALSLAVVAGLGFVRVAQHLYAMFQSRTRFRNWLQPARRIGWTVIADLLLVFTALRIWSSADVAVIQNLATVVFVLMVGAADVAWAMLVEVSREHAG